MPSRRADTLTQKKGKEKKEKGKMGKLVWE
jgi:hypothetical protein